MTRPRNPDGTFKSALDAAIEREEAEWYAEIKAKMAEGMTFDEAHIACGGDVIPLPGASTDDIRETVSAYEKVRGASAATDCAVTIAAIWLATKELK